MNPRVAVPVSLLLLTAGIAWAQVVAEPIPKDALQLYAPIASQLIQTQFPNPPVKVDVDPSKAVGMHFQEKYGVFAMPDKTLTAESVSGAAEGGTPVGILATKDLAVADGAGSVQPDKISIADLNGMVKLPVFFLSVRSKGEERMLDVFSKDMKPLVTTPVKKVEGAAAAGISLKLMNIDLEKKTADAIVGLGGSYEATVRLGIFSP